MKLKIIDLEYFKKHINEFKKIYDIYMFGENSYDYYEYCRIRDKEYGEFDSIMEFANAISRLQNPEVEILLYPYECTENSEEERTRMVDEYKVTSFFYNEYLKYCKENEFSPLSISSYNSYVNETNNDFL